MFAENEVITQDGVALLFAKKYADLLQFCHDTGAWFVWDRVHWKRETTSLAFQFCRELGREAGKQASSKAELKELRKVTFANGVEKFARGDRRVAVTSERWDRDPFLLGTPDGTLDLRTGLLRAADPADGITRLVAVAPRSGAACPIWMRFLGETFGDDAELIRFMQQWFGYCLTGDTREHALWFGFGNGGNGKGVLLNTVSGIMRDYAVAAPMSTFTATKHDAHPTEIAMLRGARLVTASETERNRAWAESRVKQLTGGDPITARFMHRDFFTFQPEFKLSIVGNHKPPLRSVDGAVRRRFNLVPFMNTPAVVDRQLEFRLRAEWPAILQWMVDGCLDWQAHGLIRPTAVAQATENYFEEQDLIGQWLMEFCEERPRIVTPTADLFQSWEKYAHEAGEYAGNRKSFTQELDRRGYEKTEAGHAKTRCVRGLKLKQPQSIKRLLTVVPKDPPEAEK
jgi:putative DNA primase/helicase